MTTTDFSTSILVPQDAATVFHAINNVPGWWAPDFRGSSEKLGDEFEAIFGDVHYSKQKLIELVPNKKVSWLVTDSRLTFLSDESEWNGTKIHFEISPEGDKTRLDLTHEGLTAQVECYEVCAPSWIQYMQNSLLCLITKGKGQPGFPPAQPL